MKTDCNNTEWELIDSQEKMDTFVSKHTAWGSKEFKQNLWVRAQNSWIEHMTEKDHTLLTKH